MFCLFYDAKTKKVRSLNGSGRAGSKCTLEKIRSSLGLTNEKNAKIPMSSVHSVTVPGAAAGWVDVVENFGSGMSLEQVLTPAIEMGEKGFPLHEITSLQVRITRQNSCFATNEYMFIVETSRKITQSRLSQLR